jgi:hypothetical protein
MNRLNLSAVLIAFAVGATLLFAPSQASADARSHCQRRVEKAQQHYRQEAREHGRDSAQAQDARARLTSEWDRCYNEVHSWYDPNRHEWRNDRDWDRNYDWDHDRDDRDRDHDHDNH